jgi:hypothetical protein
VQLCAVQVFLHVILNTGKELVVDVELFTESVASLEGSKVREGSH